MARNARKKFDAICRQRRSRPAHVRSRIRDFVVRLQNQLNCRILSDARIRPNQTVRMHRLIWVFAVFIWHKGPLRSLHIIINPKRDWITRNTTFVTYCLLSCTPNPSKKGSTLKGKHLLPSGSKCFPFRVDPFLGGIKKHFDSVTALESVTIPLKVDTVD